MKSSCAHFAHFVRIRLFAPFPLFRPFHRRFWKRSLYLSLFSLSPPPARVVLVPPYYSGGSLHWHLLKFICFHLFFLKEEILNYKGLLSQKKILVGHLIERTRHQTRLLVTSFYPSQAQKPTESDLRELTKTGRVLLCPYVWSGMIRRSTWQLPRTNWKNCR